MPRLPGKSGCRRCRACLWRGNARYLRTTGLSCLSDWQGCRRRAFALYGSAGFQRAWSRKGQVCRFFSSHAFERQYRWLCSSTCYRTSQWTDRRRRSAGSWKECWRCGSARLLGRITQLLFQPAKACLQALTELIDRRLGGFAAGNGGRRFQLFGLGRVRSARLFGDFAFNDELVRHFVPAFAESIPVPGGELLSSPEPCLPAPPTSAFRAESNACLAEWNHASV